MSDSRFRSLLALYIITLLAAIGAGFLPGGYSQVLVDAHAEEQQSWLFENTTVAFIVVTSLLSAIVAGLIGLFFFRRWGRNLSLYSTLASLCLYAFLGPTLQSPLESAFVELSTLLWGAVLALSYWSPVAARFDSVRFGADDAFKPEPISGHQDS